MMKKIENVLFVLLIFIYTSVSSQSGTISESGTTGKYQNIIPPSPSAFAFSNYGNLPANLFIGTPRINIPLLQFKTENITVPITLDYTSAGVSVDQFETLVGQSWSFNTGGVITKKVYGTDDDVSSIKSPDSFTIMDQNTINYFKNFVDTSVYNTEYDEFSFNFSGNSGKFLISKNGSIVQLTPSDIKLERVYTNNTNYFKATDEFGIIYLFEAIEKTKYLKSSCESITPGEPTGTLVNVAWYLTKIIHPSGDEIYLEYGDSQYSYTPAVSQQLRYEIASHDFTCYYGNVSNTSNFLPPRTPVFFNCYAIQSNYIKVLKRISSNNIYDGEILFTYNQNHIASPDYKMLTVIEKKSRNVAPATIEKIQLTYLNTTNRHFLKDIRYQNSGQKYQFEYDDPQDLPNRLSTSQDLWGYFNGASNGTYFVPKEASVFRIGADRETNPLYSSKGILKRIVYPTGGTTTLEYEQNSYWASKRKVHQYQLIEGTIDYQTPGATGQSSFFNYIKNFTTGNIDQTEPASVGATISFKNEAICPPFYNPDIPEKADLSVTISLFDVDENKYISIYQGAGSPIVTSPDYMVLRVNSEPQASVKVLLKANHNYQLKISSPKCITVDFGVSTYYSTYDPADLPTGGVRLKKQTDNADGNPVIKRYYYNTFAQRNVSSGNEPEIPYYYSSYEVRNYCNNDPNSAVTPNCNYSSQVVGVVHSSPIFSLFDTSMNSNVFYENVTESLGGDNAEKGRIEHKFNINKNASFTLVHQGNSLLSDGTGIISSGYSNTGWDHGNELETKYISNTNKMNKIIKRTFIKQVRDQTKYHSFIFSQVFPRKCLWLDTDLGNMLVGYYFKERYRNQLSEEEVSYYPNETAALVTKTKYFYDNPIHYQITRKQIIYPDNNIEEENYQYAYEKGNQLMIDKNMLGVPLESTQIKTVGGNARIITKTETIYPLNQAEANTKSSGLVLPLSVKSYNLQNLTVASTEVTYDRYDSKGNVLQYTTKEGTPVSIIWGYNKTQPIAKIEGVTYSHLSQNYPDDIANIVNASNTDSEAGPNNNEADFLFTMQIFRTKLNIDRFQPLITTYTYDPLIGVRSITPPSGIRESYIYDAAGRLEKMIDANGKVLKEMKYNYKN